MDIQTLTKVANVMVSPGKGILAIDESHPTCKKRFEKLGVEFTEENRRAYRELLITAPGTEQYLSGMILFDETIRQKTSDGTPFSEVLKRKGIIPGIKVDAGTKELELYPGEKITEGLDGLAERLKEYIALGAKFAKWRAVITVGPKIPTSACIKANAQALAQYAAICQELNVVPIVEPEILIDGDHTIERCYEVCAATWDMIFAELAEQGIALAGMILKTSMVLSGKDNPAQASTEEIARLTVKCLKEHVPHSLAGVVFLSGGQDDEDATIRLNAMHRLGEMLPWPLSFSYGRGIQNPALKIWATDKTKIKEAQVALLERARANALASRGKYKL
ncbi:MAG: class I fructose-bisphosphate aldolase [bacterium]|nr:class I fructose-bisphosphate aldolase [bacterium]